MSTAWSRSTRYFVAGGVAFFVVYLLYLSRTVLPLLIMAAVLSFLLLPIINGLHVRLRLPRGLAVLVTYLGGVLGFWLVVLFILPAVVGAIRFVVDLDYDLLIERVVPTLAGWTRSVQGVDLPLTALEEAVDEAARAALDYLEGAASITVPVPAPEVVLRRMGSVVSVSFNLVSGFIGTVLSPLLTGLFVWLLSIYISMDAHRFKGRLLGLAPEAYRGEWETLLWRVQHVWKQYLRGQATLMALIGVVVWLGLSALGLPYALPLGIVAGLCEIIPNLGPLLALLPAVVVALAQGSTLWGFSPLVLVLIVIVFYAVVQQLENSIVIPRVLGDAVNLHPVVVMVGILVGATNAGVLGALMALPMIASGREIITYLYRKILGQAPFPAGDGAPELREKESLWEALRKRTEALRGRGWARGAPARASVAPPSSQDGQPPHSVPQGSMTDDR